MVMSQESRVSRWFYGGVFKGVSRGFQGTLLILNFHSRYIKKFLVKGVCEKITAPMRTVKKSRRLSSMYEKSYSLN